MHGYTYFLNPVLGPGNKEWQAWMSVYISLYMAPFTIHRGFSCPIFLDCQNQGTIAVKDQESKKELRVVSLSGYGV